MKNPSFSLSVLLAMTLLLFVSSCKRTQSVDTHYDPNVTAFTSGVVSCQSAIRIVFSKPVEGVDADTRLFKISPSIDGAAVWQDNNTILFKPSSLLKSDTRYSVTFKLGKLFSGSSDFVFSFATMKQGVRIEDVSIENVSVDLSINNYILNMVTADFIGNDDVEASVEARQNGKNLDIDWEHNEGDKSHTLKVKGVVRGPKAGSIDIKLKNELGAVAENKSFTYEVPSITDYKIMDVKPVLHPDQYLQVTFSDPLRENQNLAGLITIEGADGLRYDIVKNKVRVYPSMRVSGTRVVNINQGIINILGKPLKDDFRFDISFENQKPQIKLMSEGTIMPPSTGLSLPFKAVSLKSVEVRVIKLFENNIPSFLQTNSLSGDGLYELRRAGRLIVKKTIRLDEDQSLDLTKWNVFSLDLAKLITPDPGAVYRVSFKFKKRDAIYPCMDEENDALTTIPDDDADLKNEQKTWDAPDRYFSYWDDWDEDYDWYQRENPCNSSYYSGKEVAVNILASDLGLVAKGGNDGKIVVSVSSITSTHALGGVSIDVLSYQNQIVGSGKTGSDGMATIDIQGVPYLVVARKDKERGYMRIDDGSSLSLSRFDVTGQTMQQGMKGYLYSERGVWRPGDSIFVSFVLENRGQQLPESHPVGFELINPQGRTEQKMVQPLGRTNLLVFRTATTADAVTGTYTARVIVGNATFEKQLRVETIKPNRLKLTLDFPGDFLRWDKQQGGRLTAKWLHGATARNLKASVSVTLSKGSTSFKGYDGFVFDDPVRSFTADEVVVFDGKLDASGEAVITPNIRVAEAAPGMLKASFYTRVFEEGGNFSIDRFTIPYAPYPVFVGIKTPKADGRGMLVTDKAHTVEVVTVDAEGKPVSVNNLKYEVYKVNWRWWWESDDNELASYRGSQSSRLVTSGTLSTRNGSGSFEFMVKYPEWGRYLVRVSNGDDKHATGKTVYVDWPGWAVKPMGEDAQASQMLSMALDKDKYNPGDKVKVTFPSSAGGRALVSIENGYGVLQSHWVETKEEMTSFSFEVSSAMTPNVYVNITMLQPHSQTLNNLPLRMYGVMPVMVEDPATHLSPVISTDSEMKPEQTTIVKVNEKGGKPMNYTLAVVEEGLLDITRFATPDPWNHFFAREALGVKTWDLYGSVMGAFSGRIEKAFAIGGDAELVGKKGDGKQNRFKPVVKFYGPFSLGKGKTASHKIDIPQYVGSVRVMVVASSDKAYGSAEKAVPVRSPLMILSTLPRVCGPEETIVMPVTIFSMGNQLRNVKVSLAEYAGFVVDGDNSIETSIDANSEKVVYFKLKALEKPMNGKIRINAQSGGDKAVDETFIAIRPSNPPQVKTVSSLVDAGSSAALKPIRFGLDGTEKITLEASVIPPLNLGERLHYLINYPHGCAEQTTSAAFPQLYLSGIIDNPQSIAPSIQHNVNAAISRLFSMQLSDGGIAYWPGNNTADEWTTSYAGYFLSEASRKGYVLPDGMMKRWIAFQNKVVREWTKNKERADSDVQQAFRLFTLAQAGSTNLGAMNRLRKMEGLSPMARWYLAGAYAKAGYSSEGAAIVADTSPNFGNSDVWRNTYGSETRDMAIVLEVYNLLKMKDNAFDMVRRISDNLSSGQWMSTQTTAYALLAVSHYLENNKSSTSFAIDITQDGKSTKLKSQTPMIVQELNSDVENVSVANRGDGSVFTRIVTSAIPKSGEETSASSNLVMNVAYFNMKGEPMDVSGLAQGTDIVCVVTVSNPGSLGYINNLSLTHIVPSGWEIRNTRLEEFTAYQDSPVDYRDYRDDRVLTYFGLASGETKRIVTLLHAAYQGRYYLPGVNCQAMYDNRVSASVAGRWIEVQGQ